MPKIVKTEALDTGEIKNRIEALLYSLALAFGSPLSRE
jgi:hypothetical protein